MDIRLTRNTVEIFFRSNRVALHVRSHVIQRDPVVNPEHMTPEHRKYLNYNAEDFIAFANGIGHKTVQVVKNFLDGGKEAEQGFKACASLMKMAERYSAERIESVCSKVLMHTATPSIRIINTVLKNGQDKQYESETPSETDYSNSYGITRGVEYFRKGGASK